MRYIIPPQYYLYNILAGGENFESLVDQQLFLAKNGVDWTTSDNFMDIEREVAVGLLVKHKKDENEQRNIEFALFCRLLGGVVT